MFKLILKLFFLSLIGISSVIYADKIKNLTSIEGIRDNQLIGYGLVVGLNGTGDLINQVPFTIQTLNNMLSQLGIKNPIYNPNIQLKNIASVIVTAKFPPFGLQGDKIDVLVSSIGNSSSLAGGTLLMTPLKGIDNQIYAIAQGKLTMNILHNTVYKKNNEHNTLIPQFNSGRIHYGAIIEREVKNNFSNNKIIKLQLYNEDFTLAKIISEKINVQYKNIATAINSKSVIISTKSLRNNEKVNIISNIQNIDIPMYKSEPKIIINSNTGSVVINKEVKLNSCLITYKNFTIFFDKSKKQYFYKSDNPLKKSLKYTINNDNNLTLSHIIQTLNLFKIKPLELISILQSMKHANCLINKIQVVS